MRWSNAKHEAALKRRRQKELEKYMKPTPQYDTTTHPSGNKTNEPSTQVLGGNGR